MPSALLDFYKAIEDSSVRMLEAARVQDWDRVVRYEGACAVLIEQLRFCARQQQLDGPARVEKSMPAARSMRFLTRSGWRAVNMVLMVPPMQ